MSYTVISNPIIEGTRVSAGFYSPSLTFSSLEKAIDFASHLRNKSAIVKTGNNELIYRFLEYESDDDITD